MRALFAGLVAAVLVLGWQLDHGAMRDRLTAARDSLRAETYERARLAQEAREWRAHAQALNDSLADCEREFRAQRARAERAEWRLDLCREGGR